MSALKTKENDYRSTLNLPQTAFPMKADLVKKEPEILKRWDETGLYEALLAKNRGKPLFVLHDGPPYANGNIHFGHILNKILKDIIVKFKSMTGQCSPFIPGWDCHGLPIEHQVDKDLGPKKKTMSKLQIRKACREYAMKYVAIQRSEFKRLGILGDWNHPYLTMSFDYEAAIAREFGRFVRGKSVYKALRPVLWCAHCRTALAEAETDYTEKESPAIYVRLHLHDKTVENFLPKLKGHMVSLVIWTTTPWTLPANLAVALHENYDYVVFPYRQEYFIVAKQLAGAFSKILGLGQEPEAVERFPGKRLENQFCCHPFLKRDSKIVLSDHVTMDTGTGCVHIAPGHGEDDYAVGLKYNLEILSPVDQEGRFTAEVGVEGWVGLNVLDPQEANAKVLEKLREEGVLLHEEKIRHMYPHCWRCKNPLLSRATEQYFLSLEANSLRAKALDAIRRVKWIPPWGRERIYGMIERRGDWCLSRQRSWGVPIIAFKCSSCSEILLDAEVISRVADRFEKEGSDIWFSEPPEKFLPEGTTCPNCKKQEQASIRGVGFTPHREAELAVESRDDRWGSQGESGIFPWLKEGHILDVWFDSGVSFAAVLEGNPALKYPADLYLEGSDQHRGWFHSSLLCSIGTRSKPPYETVLTHGFVVDSEGKKYSKSAGNYVPPDKVLKESGAEILRLWVAAEDYRSDIRVSPEILSRLVEAYRKIRNTCRFILGNLYDFDPDSMGGIKVESASTGSAWRAMSSHGVDLWALHHLQKLIDRLRRAYEEFNFHIIFHELNRYCTVDLSAFYLDILKDRLYTSGKDDPARRAAQGVLFQIVSALARLMAPIFSFTAEEIWRHLPSFKGKASSVHLADFPEPAAAAIDESLARRWDSFHEIRDEVLKALEAARQKKEIGNSLEARVVLAASGDPEALLRQFQDQLPELLQVSQVDWGEEIPETAYRSEKFPSLFVDVGKAMGQKCDRCWRWSTEVGSLAAHPSLCGRCHEVLSR